MIRVIGIGEWAFSAEKNAIIKTFALGSCVAMTLYCPTYHVAGMVHIVLPSPQYSRLENDYSKLGYYATSAVPMMIDKMRFGNGCTKEELRIEIFGGADSARIDDPFRIGIRNVCAVKEALASLGLRCRARTGGRVSRTVEIEVATGKTRVFYHRMIL